MSERSDLYTELWNAESDEKVLAILARMYSSEVPSLAQLREWYGNCLQSVKDEVQERLRALWPDRCRFDLFPSQRSLALDSSVDDASPLVVNREFLTARQKGKKLLHPWAILVKSWQEHCPVARAKLRVKRERRPSPNKQELVLARVAGVLNVASLAVVKVDGQPFASGAPLRLDGPMLRYRVQPMIEQPDLGRSLQPYPRKMAGRATAGMLVEAIARINLAGDDRSPLRADVLRLGEVAYGLTRTIHFSEAEGAVVLGGRDSPALRKRLHEALWVLRTLGLEVRKGRFYPLAVAEPGTSVNALGPPLWWVQAMREQQVRRKRKASSKDPVAYRLSGGLFRPLSFGRAGDGRRGSPVGLAGHLRRTIAGIEAALTWGPTPGSGLDAKTPSYVIPVQPGKHGEHVTIAAWEVLRFSGENVDQYSMGKAAQGRYRRRIAALEQAGYFLNGRKAALAEDTVEIVEAKRGARGRPARLVVRATARFCEGDYVSKLTKGGAGR